MINYLYYNWQICNYTVVKYFLNHLITKQNRQTKTIMHANKFSKKMVMNRTWCCFIYFQITLRSVPWIIIYILNMIILFNYILNWIITNVTWIFIFFENRWNKIKNFSNYVNLKLLRINVDKNIRGTGGSDSFVLIIRTPTLLNTKVVVRWIIVLFCALMKCC